MSDRRRRPLTWTAIPDSNICRSPLAEAVFADIVHKRGLDIEVDSAGTAGYHVGEEPVSGPDPVSRRVLQS